MFKLSAALAPPSPTLGGGHAPSSRYRTSRRRQAGAPARRRREGDVRSGLRRRHLAPRRRRRRAVREALADMSREFQQLQIDELAGVLDRYGVDTDQFPAELAVLALGGIARSIVREGAMGSAVGHDVALAAIERLIDRLETGRG